MMRRLSRHSAGHELWPALLLLVLVVLVPTAVLTWLVGRAAENERLVVRQRLAETHQAALRRMQEEVETDLFRLLQRCDRLAMESGVEQLAAEVVEQQLADAVVCFDERGRVIFPAPLGAGAQAPLDESEPWQEAVQWEFQLRDPGRAAERFAAIAALSEHPEVKARAGQAQARCLAKAGDVAAAIDVFRQLVETRGLREARGVHHRLIAADAGLRALELMTQNAYPEAEIGAVRRLLIDLISLEAGAKAPSSQRRFIARRLHEMFPKQLEFPWLAAEELGAKYVAAHGSVSPSKTLQPTSLKGVWQIASPQRRVVLLWRSSTLAERIARGGPAGPSAPLRAVALAPDSPNRTEEYLAVAHLPALPGWRLALAAEEELPLEANSGRRAALYGWTAALAMGAVVAAAALVARTLGRQYRLNQMQNDWLATVSHELKTPLSSIQLLTDSLLEEDNVDRAAYLRLISHETVRLTRLIERLLMLTRNGHTAALLEPRPVPVGDVVDSACEAMGERLQAPGCEFRRRLDENLPPLLVDPDAVTVVLVNLLENAWKFTGREKRISLTAQRDGDQVCLRVSDNGVGMTPGDARRAFDRFYQVDRRLSREQGGCGLGLSIVKQLVEAHGGSVSVESRQGQGSTFSVRLPAVVNGTTHPTPLAEATAP
jgi:signal transduction histidine kinase